VGHTVVFHLPFLPPLPFFFSPLWGDRGVVVKPAPPTELRGRGTFFFPLVFPFFRPPVDSVRWTVGGVKCGPMFVYSPGCGPHPPLIPSRLESFGTSTSVHLARQAFGRVRQKQLVKTFETEPLLFLFFFWDSFLKKVFQGPFPCGNSPPP